MISKINILLFLYFTLLILQVHHSNILYSRKKAIVEPLHVYVEDVNRVDEAEDIDNADFVKCF